MNPDTDRIHDWKTWTVVFLLSSSVFVSVHYLDLLSPSDDDLPDDSPDDGMAHRRPNPVESFLSLASSLATFVSLYLSIKTYRRESSERDEISWVRITDGSDTRSETQQKELDDY